jgi:hypothetical protein
MMLRKLVFLLLFSSLLLSACAGLPATPASHKTPLAPPPSATLPPAPTDDQPPYPPAVTAARQALADLLMLQPDAISVAAYAPAEWSDSCLGLGGASESCAQVVTPGYRVILKAGEKFYVYHSNQDGSTLRQELAAANLPEAAILARQALAAALGLPHELLVSIIKVEAVEWPDSCLGVSSPDVMCAQVVTPGYRILLEANGRQYEYHTNETGSQIVPLQAQLPSMGNSAAVLTWQSQDEPCQSIEIDAQRVSYGACDSPLALARLSSVRLAELGQFQAAYASFQTDTPSGKIVFQGKGSLAPTPAQQRALAEWARLVLLEAQSGRSTADQGLALAWHRDGGIAGFCDDLLVYAYGRVQATNCKLYPADARVLQLDSSQLEQLYAWLDAFQPIQDYQTDPAVADAMTVELLLKGNGSQAAANTDRQAIIDFAMTLYQQAQK